MFHQPYEDWLFSEEPLTSQETAALQDHLQSCESCRLFSAAWRKVECELQMAPLLAPDPGFTSRWQARLESERQRMQLRQSLILLGFSIGGAALLLGSLGVLAWPLLKAPEIIFWALIQRIWELFSIAVTAQDTFSALLRTVPGVVSWVWWFIFAGCLCELGVLWIVSLRLLTNPRRITQ